MTEIQDEQKGISVKAGGSWFCNSILCGDALKELSRLPSESIDCCITSPPYYGLRDYDVEGQIGLEKTPHEYIRRLVDIFQEVFRVLKKDGTVWLNLADSYGSCGGDTYSPKETGLRPKNLLGIPWRVALALQENGWYLRQDIIWAKGISGEACAYGWSGNSMPESVRDRCTKSHEYIFLLSKNSRYYYDYESMQEPIQSRYKQSDAARSFKRHVKEPPRPGQTYSQHRTDRKESGERRLSRNRRSVWTVSVRPCKEAHFAVFPEQLIEPCVLAGCPEKGIVLDPFMGSGTTACVAKRLRRNYVGMELNPKYVEIAKKRLGCRLQECPKNKERRNKQ